MDINLIEKTNAAAVNRKNAVFAMCKVSLLLLAVTVLSYYAGYGLLLLVERYSLQIQRVTVKVLMLVGAERNDAYVAARLVIGSEAFSMILNMLSTLVSLVLPAVLFARLERLSFSGVFGGKCVKGIIPMFCLCHLLTTFASMFSGMISDFMLPDSSAALYEGTGVTAQQFNIYGFIINILCTSIFIPIVEEFVFRGVIFRYLSSYGTEFGIVASAVVFGIAHSSPVQSVYAFVFGIVSALLFAVTGNLKTSILFHAGNNFITVVLGYLLAELTDKSFGFVSGIYMLVVSAVGIYGIYCLCKSTGILKQLKEKVSNEEAELSEKPGMKQLFVFPLIVYVVYYVYSVFTTVM